MSTTNNSLYIESKNSNYSFILPSSDTPNASKIAQEALELIPTDRDLELGLLGSKDLATINAENVKKLLTELQDNPEFQKIINSLPQDISEDQIKEFLENIPKELLESHPELQTAIKELQVLLKTPEQTVATTPSETSEEITAPKKPKFKLKKPQIHVLALLAMFAVCTALESVNTAFMAPHSESISKGITLAIRQWLYGLSFASAREVLKDIPENSMMTQKELSGAFTGKNRLAAQGLLILLGLCFQLAGNAAVGSKSPIGSISAIALGVALCFTAKDIRNTLLPKIDPENPDAPKKLPAEPSKYLAVCALIITSLALQTFTFQTLGDRFSAESKAGSSGKPLLAEYAFYAEIGNLLKGPLKHVSSSYQHYGVLFAFLAISLSIDLAFNQEVGGTFGQTTKTSGLIGLAYLNKSICYTIMGFCPWGFNPPKQQTKLERNNNLKIAYGVNGMVATAGTVVNLISPLGGAVSTFGNLVFSAMNRKAAKSELKLACSNGESTKEERINAMFYRSLFGMVVSGVVSGVYYAITPNKEDAFTAFIKASSVPAIILTNYVTKARIDAKKDPNQHAHEKVSSEESAEIKGIETIDETEAV